MGHESEDSVVLNGGSWGAPGKRRVGTVLFALLAAIFAAFLVLASPAFAQSVTFEPQDVYPTPDSGALASYWPSQTSSAVVETPL